MSCCEMRFFEADFQVSKSIEERDGVNVRRWRQQNH